MRKHLRRNVDMKRRSVNARRRGNGSLANECLQWPIWIRLSWIFRLLLHLEGTYTSGIPGHLFMDFSTLHAYHCSPHTYFQTGHRTRLSGIIPHFHVFHPISAHHNCAPALALCFIIPTAFLYLFVSACRCDPVDGYNDLVFYPFHRGHLLFLFDPHSQ